MFSLIKKIFGINHPDHIRDIINQGAILVDVRTPNEFDNGHVKGSINIPLDRITHNLKRFENKNHIIVFCRSGNRSSQAKSILIQNGIENVTNGGTWQSINQILKSKN